MRQERGVRWGIMTNGVAAVLAGLVLVLVLGDQALNGGTGTLFMVHRLLDLVEYLTFWR